ncbi:uncharacterized protein LOC118438177 [Folsomia candida]|nr:uncharacterized protein LOC118438177 [Folsomia candida]
MEVPRLIQEMVDTIPVDVLTDEETMPLLLRVLNKTPRSSPLGVVDALAFLWVYVGLLVKKGNAIGEKETVTRYVINVINNFFRIVVRSDKHKKNMEHILNLYNAVKTLHKPPTAGEELYFELPEFILTGPYLNENLELEDISYVPEEFFKNMCINSNVNVVSDAIDTLTSSTSEKKKKRKAIEQSQPDDATTSSQIKEESDDEICLIPPTIEEDDANTSNIPASDGPSFITDPNIVVNMNPTLFPSDNTLGWSARSLLPSKRTKKSTSREDFLPHDNSPPPIIPPNCAETILPIDFTQDDYAQQMFAHNYYAQGIKMIDGLRRVVFYHNVNN